MIDAIKNLTLKIKFMFIGGMLLLTAGASISGMLEIAKANHLQKIDINKGEQNV